MLTSIYQINPKTNGLYLNKCLEQVILDQVATILCKWKSKYVLLIKTWSKINFSLPIGAPYNVLRPSIFIFRKSKYVSKGFKSVSALVDSTHPNPST